MKLHILDRGTKTGLSSWLNMQLISAAYDGLQKQAEQLLEMYRDVMGGNYFRINFSFKEPIRMDKKEDIPLMEVVT